MVLQTCMTTVFTVDFPAQLIAHCLVSMLALQTSRAWLVFAYLSSEWLSLWCLFDEGPEPLPLRHVISFLWLSSYWISSSATRHPKSATCAFPLWYVFQTRKHYSVVWTYFFLLPKISSFFFLHSPPFQKGLLKSHVYQRYANQKCKVQKCKVPLQISCWCQRDKIAKHDFFKNFSKKVLYQKTP